MWIIMRNALRERLRRKELYIIVVIGAVLFLLCSSGVATISISGEPITGFRNMFLVLHTIINAIGCLLGVILSIRTIPNEYERRNSHLIWVRGISQQTYHVGLVMANVISSILATLILYGMLLAYTMIKGEGHVAWKLLAAFLLVAVNVGITSLFTSVLSIVLPVAITGTIGILLAFLGIFHGVFDLYRNVAGGIAGVILRILLKLIPDLNGIQMQAQNFVMGKKVNVHLILTGLLALYVCSLGIIIFKRKEA